MPTLLAYTLLFTGLSAFFIFSHLMIGKLVRPSRPDAEKKTIYECGEPTVGSAWIQFDVRFYVVALLFVIFDVEMAFFFPWAVVFGKANQLSDHNLPPEQRLKLVDELGPRDMWRRPGEVGQSGKDPKAYALFKQSAESGAPILSASERVGLTRGEMEKYGRTDMATPVESNREASRAFALTAFFDIIVFFGVLLVGFAYLWRRGDIDWVRSTIGQKSVVKEQQPAVAAPMS